MPPRSFCEWVVGQNVRPRKKSNGLRHVVSFEVVTDDESGTDMYKIAVPREKHAAPTKPALKQPSHVDTDSETEATADVSEETSGDEEASDWEIDMTCPCTTCIDGRKKLSQMKQAKSRGTKQKQKPVTVAAPSSEEDSEDYIAAVVHAKHQAKKSKKQKKKVTFAVEGPEESENDASSAEVKYQAKKDKPDTVAVVSASSGGEGDSEASVIEAKVETKKGKKGVLSMAMTLSSDDESESEANVSQVKAHAKRGKKVKDASSPESTAVESESDAPSAKQQTKKTKAKSKKAEKDKPKNTEPKRKRSSKKDKQMEVETTEDETEPSESNSEDAPSGSGEDSEEEEEVQVKSSKKSGMKDKRCDGKKGAKEKAENKKKDKRKARQKKKSKDKIASVSESGSGSDSDIESEAEVEIPKKTKIKKTKKTVRFSPANPVQNMRHPGLLLPPRTSVMHVEHAVETPQDPRPNAFYDNESGTTRVYHGPAYGNPSGMLYPHRAYDYRDLPVGVPRPTQNPWYNGFPPTNEQYAAPRPPPQEAAADESNPWFRGWGTVGPPPNTGNTPLPPNFIAGRPNDNRKQYGQHESPSPPRSHGSRDRDVGWDSNVVPIPSIEVTAPNGPPAKGYDDWKARSAQGAPSSPLSPDEDKKKKKKRKDTTAMNMDSLNAVLNSNLSGIGKALQEAAARDAVDLRVREERWSNRSGSSKEPSPQPSSGWNDNANKSPTKNSDNGLGTKANNDWDTLNANTGGDSAWDGTKANNNNDTSGWGNNEGDDGWNTTKDSGWDTANNNGDWDAGSNNWDWDNTNAATKNDNGKDESTNSKATSDENNGNRWASAPPPSSPVPKNATAIPGTWSSPVQSSSGRPGRSTRADDGGGGRNGSPVNKNKSKGKGKDKGKGKAGDWGDATLAQSSGGYWNTDEGKADIAKGTGNTESWW